MRAIVMHETGGIDKLKLEEVPDPVPERDDVIVKVWAAGVWMSCVAGPPWTHELNT